MAVQHRRDSCTCNGNDAAKRQRQQNSVDTVRGRRGIGWDLTFKANLLLSCY